MRPSTSCTSVATMRWRRSAKLVIAACLFMPKPVLSTCTSRLRTSTSPALKAPSTFSRRRCEKWHQEKLWKGLKNDHLQVVSTDHCPFCFKEQKSLGKDDFTKIPNGGPGIENRLQLLYHHGVNQGRLSVNRFVELVSTTPARLFGLYPRKGELAAGSDADIVIWDPNAEHEISAKTHHMRVDYSMFEGFRVKGNARMVLSRGEVIVDEGRFLGKT